MSVTVTLFKADPGAGMTSTASLMLANVQDHFNAVVALSEPSNTLFGDNLIHQLRHERGVYPFGRAVLAGTLYDAAVRVVRERNLFESSTDEQAFASVITVLEEMGVTDLYWLTYRHKPLAPPRYDRLIELSKA